MPNKKKKNIKNFKPKPKKGEFNEKEYNTSRCPGNDFAWYNQNPELLTSASALIFSKKYGDKYNSLSYSGSNYTVSNDCGNRSVVGVIRATYYPFISAEGTDADAINIAAKNLQTWLRHKNTGAKVYEQSDLIQVLLSTGSIKAAIEYVKKLIRCVASYSAVNRFAMRQILPFTDAEVSNIVDNIANYTGKLNLIIGKASSLIIPKDIPLFARWKWLSANVFKDDQLAKCSFYTFQPEIIWHWDWANHKCTEQTLINGTLSGMLSIIESEVNNLLAYEDYGTITGDILKVYEDKIDITTAMELGEIQDPTYDPAAIQQFKNMIITNHSYGYEIDQVGGNTQLVYTKCTTAQVQTAKPGKWVYFTTNGSNPFDAGFRYLPKLAVTSDQPTIEECVEQTRFTYAIHTTNITGIGNVCYLEDVGTEIITGCKCIYYTGNPAAYSEITLDTLFFGDRTDGSEMYDFAETIMLLKDVTGAPQMCLIAVDGTNMYGVQSFSGDNITVLDEQYLHTIHEACVLSEWTMPMFNALKVK